MISRQTFRVEQSELVARAAGLLESGHRLALVAPHDDGDVVRVVYVFTSLTADRRIELEVLCDASAPAVPSLSSLSFPASRFEREMHDLFGVVPEGHTFLRPLAVHQHWPQAWHPMRRDAGPMPPVRTDTEPFPFIEVAGSGVYEIPVGPVHAGLIEPGHFRFSVAGETIIKMTARLWYLHRGMELLFQGRSAAGGVELAERLSGDTAVGHGLAYSLAVEEACGLPVSDDVSRLRAVLLEMERLYNHVADIGALCNDIGFGLVQARALIIRETLLRLNEEITGHRLLRGAVWPGGGAVLRLPAPDELVRIEEAIEGVVDLAMSNSVVVDRFEGTATLGAEEAVDIGTLGVVARASGSRVDARAIHPFVDLGTSFETITETTGDVMARFNVRVREARISMRILRELVQNDNLGDRRRVEVGDGGSGVGIVEGWRGTIVHRVEVANGDSISRCKVADPSFFNWPALAVSLADTIVPDFPLANKSFNLSYAGNDL